MILVHERGVEVQADEQIRATAPGAFGAVGERKEIVAVTGQDDFKDGRGQQHGHTIDFGAVRIEREDEPRPRVGQLHFLALAHPVDLKIEGFGPVGQADVIIAKERGALQFAQRALRRRRQQTSQSREQHDRQSH